MKIFIIIILKISLKDKHKKALNLTIIGGLRLKMATYKYKCENCGEFTVKMKMSEYKPLEVCPTCGSEVKRIFEVPSAMIFKGDGFYVNDYKKASEKPKDTGTTCCGGEKSNTCPSCSTKD